MNFFSDRKIIVKLVIIIYSVVIILSLGACTPKGNPDNGRRWYNMHNCSCCHGDKGKNGKAPPIAGLELGFGSFLKNLRKPNSGSKNTYSEAEISIQDAVDMYVWLKGNPQ